MTGTQIGHAFDLKHREVMEQPGALEAYREQAVAALRIVGVRKGLVLDESSVVYEGMMDSMFGPGGALLRYTAYAYPAGQVPQ